MITDVFWKIAESQEQKKIWILFPTVRIEFPDDGFDDRCPGRHVPPSHRHFKPLSLQWVTLEVQLRVSLVTCTWNFSFIFFHPIFLITPYTAPQSYTISKKKPYIFIIYKIYLNFALTVNKPRKMRKCVAKIQKIHFIVIFPVQTMSMKIRRLWRPSPPALGRRATAALGDFDLTGQKKSFHLMFSLFFYFFCFTPRVPHTRRKSLRIYYILRR